MKPNAERRPKLISIKVRREPDESPDYSFIGEFTDNPDPWNIVRSTGKYVAEMDQDEDLPPRGREYRFIAPYAGGEKPGTADYKKYGLQDAERLEALSRGDWIFVGFWIEALCSRPSGNFAGSTLTTFRSPGLWGIESDSGDDYFREVADDELVFLKEELVSYGVKIPSDKKLRRALEIALDRTDEPIVVSEI